MLLLPNYFLQENVLSIIILWDNVWVVFDFMLKTIKV